MCTSSGLHWEELFESLFGFESKQEARDRWARRPRASLARVWRMAQTRSSNGSIRGWPPVARQRARRPPENRRTKAGKPGRKPGDRRRKAERAARALVATAFDIRETIRFREGTITVNRSIAEAMREAALKPETVLLEHERGLGHGRDQKHPSILAGAANLVVGPKVRFLCGAALLAGSIAWMHQNAMLSQEHAIALVAAAKSGDLTAVQTHAQAGLAHARQHSARKTELLDLPVLPQAVRTIVSSFGAGVGGLILIISSLFSGLASRSSQFPPRPFPSWARAWAAAFVRARPELHSQHPGRGCHGSGASVLAQTRITPAR